MFLFTFGVDVSFLSFSFFFFSLSHVGGWYSIRSRAMWHVLFVFHSALQGFVSVLLHTFFTMSVSSGDDGSVLECAAQGGPGSAGEFRAGWEGWLRGACLAQLASNEDDAIPIAVLRAGQNGFLVLAEEGDFPCTGPWHCNGWVDDYSHYHCFGRLIYMDPFDKRFFDSSGVFSAHMVDKGCIVYDKEAGGHCCWLDAGDWWIFLSHLLAS